MYVIYDSVQSIGVDTDLEFVRVANGDPYYIDVALNDHRTECHRKVERIWYYFESSTDDLLESALAPDEDAFCLDDGRMLVFRP